jgi:Flp pilus assembly protein CpaB
VSRLAAGWHDLRRAMRWHRRLLAAVLAAAGVATALQALAPQPAATTAVLAASRDLVGGARLRAGDLRVVRLPAGTVPDGALRPGARTSGRVLAGPARRGEPITDVRLLGPSLLAGYVPGHRRRPTSAAAEPLVATPVRIADAGSAALLHAGDLVDVLSAAARGGQPVAESVRVLAVPRTRSGGSFLGGSSGPADGALVVLATSPRVSARLARAAGRSPLAVAIRPTG